MDGDQDTTRIRGWLRQGIVPFALMLAMLLATFVAIDDGAAADEMPASIRYAAGSPAMLAAQDIARRQWGVEACGGQVEISWGTDEASINARSYWANPRSAYDDPELNVQCRIVFNTGLSFSWEKFCTVLVHEVGHLVGRPHVGDGADVMSPIYRAPLPACAGEPDPAAVSRPVAAPAPVVDAPVQRPTARKRAKAARARAATAERHYTSTGHAH